MHLHKVFHFFILGAVVIMVSGCMSHPSRPSHHSPHHLKNDIDKKSNQFAYNARGVSFSKLN